MSTRQSVSINSEKLVSSKIKTNTVREYTENLDQHLVNFENWLETNQSEKPASRVELAEQYFNSQHLMNKCSAESIPDLDNFLRQFRRWKKRKTDG